MIWISLIKTFSKKFPILPEDLRKAGMRINAEDFIKKVLISSAYMTLGLLFILFMLLAKMVDTGQLIVTLLFCGPIMFLVMFFYFFQSPIVRISKIDREINKEIVFAGRFLVVELESGVTLYDAMKNMKKSYPVVGAYFSEIVDKINIGTPIEDAVSESIDKCPSPCLTKILWQVSNSLRTGSNITKPLKSVVETLIREQQIMINEYGRKLNPLAMFYMLIAIIVPSLGVTMLTIVAIFVGLRLDLTVLLIIAFFIGFLQFMFVAMVNSIRPPVEL